MAVTKKDRKIVNAFIAYLNCGYRGLEIKYPEDDTQGDIDAIAGQFAIEHTSVDTLPNQRRDSNWFMQAVGRLEEELKPILFRLNIRLHYDSIIKGQNWSAIRQSIKNWINNAAHKLPDGRHNIDNIPGVPFHLRVTKSSDRKPGVYFARLAPEDDSLPQRLRQQLTPKISKLARYKEHNFTTILLIESEDIALMNEVIMFNAIQQAYPEGFPDSVDEIWFIDTSIPNNLLFWNFTEKIRKPVQNE